MGRLTPSIGHVDGSTSPSIADLFESSQIPGLAEQPDFLRYELFADVNFRRPVGNPRRGGRYYVSDSAAVAVNASIAVGPCTLLHAGSRSRLSVRGRRSPFT